VKRLILGTISDDFKPQRDMPLGPWCFLGKEDVYPGWESLPFEPDPFSTPESLHEASQKTCAYVNSLVPLLVSQLNHQNGVSYSNRFWRLMLLPWLISLVQKTYFNLLSVEGFIKKYGDKDLEVELVHDSIEWKFKDTVDFYYRGIFNPVFDHWLSSRIIEDICPSSWSKIYTEKSIEYDEIIKANMSWKILLYERLFRNRRCMNVYGIGPLYSVLWSIFLRLKPTRSWKLMREDNSEIEDVDFEWPFDFSNIIQRSIPLCFKDLTLINYKASTYQPGKCNLIGPVIYFNEKAKFRFGLAVLNGEKLIGTQHGGMYGIAKTHSYFAEVEYKLYSFFSWGWTKEEDYSGNIQALSSPYLSKFHNKHRQKSSSLIMVCTLAWLFPVRFQSSPLPMQNLKYRENKVHFLKALDNHIFKSTLYRPFFNEYGALQERPFLEKIFPTLQYCEGDLHPQIIKCKLLIMDNPDTTFNISMAANIPTIAFWDKASWPLSQQAIPYYDALEKAGVVFESGEHAAMKVNEIWNDVQGWWHQKAVQDARKDWCHQYARTSKIWWWQWIKALWNL